MYLYNDLTDLLSVNSTVFTGRNEVVAKVKFLHVSVILSTGGSPAGRTPPGRENPPWQGEHLPGKEAPPWQGDPPGKETPLWQGRPPRQGEPPRQGDPPGRETPPARRPPWQGGPPGRETPPGIRSMSGRYASYWNAFLLIYGDFFTTFCMNICSMDNC